MIYHQCRSTVIGAGIYEEVAIHQYKLVVMAIHIFFRSVIFNYEVETAKFVVTEAFGSMGCGLQALDQQETLGYADMFRLMKIHSCFDRGWTKR